MLDILTDKAYDYIKNGFDMLCIHPNNLSKQTFFNWESMFIYIKRYYKTINII